MQASALILPARSSAVINADLGIATSCRGWLIPYCLLFWFLIQFLLAEPFKLSGSS